MKRAYLPLVLLVTAIAAPVFAQPNSWVTLSPNPVAMWEPASFKDCTRQVTLANPPGRAFSGSAIGDGQIYYWGGFHHSYPGNDMVVFDIASNKWLSDPIQPQCTHPACVDPSGGPGPKEYDNYPSLCIPPGSQDWTQNCLYGSCYVSSGGAFKATFRCAGGSRDALLCATDADCSAGSVYFPGTTGTGTCTVGIPTLGTVCTSCRPYAEHTYQQKAWNPVRKRIFMATFSGTWEYDIGTRAFTWLTRPPPRSGDLANKMVVWDPPRSRMLFVQTGNDSGGNFKGVWTFNYATNVWTQLDNYSPVNNSTPFGTWDPRAFGGSGGFVISIGETPPRWFVYNPTLAGASAWTEITSGAPADVKGGNSCPGGGAKPCYATALTYDATNQRTIVLTQDPGNLLALWAYDALNNTWQKVTTANASTATTTSGYPNQLHYNTADGTLYLNEQRGIWSYGPTGSGVRVSKILLDLGHPLPTNTLGPATPTPQFTSTSGPTRTPTPRPTSGPILPTPTPGGPTPTCAGTVRQVGPGRTYAKPSQAAAVVQSNDCVHIDAGRYENDVALWRSSASNVTIRGINGRAVLTITNGLVSGSKGIWVVAGANTTIENIEFSCASSRTTNPHCSGVLVGDGNDAGIRIEAPGLTVRNCVFHDNDNGILGGPSISGTAGDVLIEHSEFFRNGLGDGFTHNLYLNAHHASVTFRYNYTHGAITGHLLKSRAPANYILYNRLTDEDNGVTTCTNAPNCMASAEIDLPCGGIAYVVGNVIQKGQRADSRDTVKFAAELSNTSCLQPPLAVQELYVVNNTMVSAYGPTTYFVRGFGAAPLLWAKNNIFWGGATQPISWPATGTKIDLSNITTDPKLLSQTTFDYHLTAASTAVIDDGIDPGSDSLGFDLLPVDHYVYDRGGTARVLSGAVDVGAFELIPGLSPFATPTPTFTNTPTQIPIPTNTPAAPVYCANGLLEAAFAIADTADDGFVQRGGSNYNALTPSSLATGGYDDYIDYAMRRNSNGNYKVGLTLWRWNTGTLPDGSAWPAGAQIVGAYLRPTWPGAGAGPRSLVFEWHNWVGSTLSQGDWVLASPATGDPTFAGSAPRPTAKGRQTIALNNATLNVSLIGYTGLRMMVADGTPPALNEDNTVGVRPVDNLTNSGDQSAQLVLCYTQGPPQPPSAPHLY